MITLQLYVCMCNIALYIAKIYIIVKYLMASD